MNFFGGVVSCFINLFAFLLFYYLFLGGSWFIKQFIIHIVSIFLLIVISATKYSYEKKNLTPSCWSLTGWFTTYLYSTVMSIWGCVVMKEQILCGCPYFLLMVTWPLEIFCSRIYGYVIYKCNSAKLNCTIACIYETWSLWHNAANIVG